MRTIVEMHLDDPTRATWLTLDACGIHADFTACHVDRKLFDALIGEIETVQIPHKFEEMFAGKIINHTEQREVDHVALRNSGSGHENIELARVQREKAFVIAEEIRSDKSIDAVINIGIGGSDLGPAMVVKALRSYCNGPIVRFVSNIDPADFDSAIKGLDPGRTVVIISSKTFTTMETMHNANRARKWMIDAGVEWKTKFVATTADRDTAIKWGITPSRCLDFYDWVGGRFSVSSVIGLPVMIAVGTSAFTQFLAGMEQMDFHVANTSLEKNLPVIHGALWFLNSVVHQFPTIAVVPYSFDLGGLPGFLQQLVMESNGKSVDQDGRVLVHPSTQVVWGATGTNGQHAFFQMLHQGTQVVPVEFVSTVGPMGTDSDAHDLLIANMLAQSQALAFGRKGVSSHRNFPGNRPSSVLMVDDLTPQRLGSLVAMYEHSVAVQGWLMGVNSFDQFGVELGKEIALDVLRSISLGDEQNNETLTHPLLKWFLENK